MCAIICSSKPTECSAPRVNRSVNYKPLPGDSDMRGRVTAYKKMYPYNEASLVAQMVKRLSTMQETQVRSLGWDDPLEKEMAAHSSILAWKIPCTTEPGRLLSMGLQRVRHD